MTVTLEFESEEAKGENLVEPAKRAAMIDSYRCVENTYEAAAHLLSLSIVDDKRDKFLFRYSDGTDELYLRHTNVLNGRGGWVSENAAVTESYIHRAAVVMGGAKVNGSAIEAGVVVRSGQEVRYATLGMNGLLRR